MERFILFVERAMEKEAVSWILLMVCIIAPAYFLKTVWDVWFGPAEVLAGFKHERSVFIVLVISDAVTFITALPARKKGLITQLVMFAWTVEMMLISIATFLL